MVAGLGVRRDARLEQRGAGDDLEDRGGRVQRPGGEPVGLAVLRVLDQRQHLARLGIDGDERPLHRLVGAHQPRHLLLQLRLHRDAHALAVGRVGEVPQGVVGPGELRLLPQREPLQVVLVLRHRVGGCRGHRVHLGRVLWRARVGLRGDLRGDGALHCPFVVGLVLAVARLAGRRGVRLRERLRLTRVRRRGAFCLRERPLAGARGQCAAEKEQRSQDGALRGAGASRYVGLGHRRFTVLLEWGARQRFPESNRRSKRIPPAHFGPYPALPGGRGLTASRAVARFPHRAGGTASRR